MQQHGLLLWHSQECIWKTSPFKGGISMLEPNIRPKDTTAWFGGILLQITYRYSILRKNWELVVNSCSQKLSFKLIFGQVFTLGQVLVIKSQVWPKTDWKESAFGQKMITWLSRSRFSFQSGKISWPKPDWNGSVFGHEFLTDSNLTKMAQFLVRSYFMIQTWPK